MPQAGFETTTPASEQPQTHALDCAATGMGAFHLVASYENQCTYTTSTPYASVACIITHYF